MDGSSATPSPAPAGPGKLVARENPVVFKKAFDDETASVKIGLRNDGGQTLRVRSIRGSCGCLRVGKVPETIEPAQEIEVEFTIRLAGMSGRVAKMARIFTDDPATPELRVGIQGDVGPRFLIDPGRAVVKRSDPREAATADLLVRSGGDEPLDDLTAVASVPGVEVTKTMVGPVARLHVVVPPEIEHPRGTITLRLGKHERVLRLTDGSTNGGIVAASPASIPRAQEGDEPVTRDGAGVLTVAFTGQDLGELEPCGCTQGMLGGIARRPARLRAFVEPGVPFLAVSGGALVAGEDAYDRLRLDTFLEALATMGAVAVGPSRRELALGAGVPGAPDAPTVPPMVAVDVDQDSTGDRDLLPMHRLELGDCFVYVTGISGPANDRTVPGLQFREPRAALRELRGDLPVFAPLVVLANVGEEAARDLAQQAGRPTLVLYAGGWTDPGPEDVEEGPIAFAPYPAEGKYVGLARLHGRGATAAWTVEYRPVDAELPEDAGMLALHKEHRERLRASNLLRDSAGNARFTPAALSGEPAARGSAAAGDYVGNAACANCHAEAVRSWTASKHAQAMQTLRTSGDDADPGCVACHVVGYGTGRGFLTEQLTPQLADVGCEACHGPRGAHVAFRSGAARAEPEPAGPKGRLACASCHDGKHDPAFQFDSYWPRIAHGAR